MKVRLTREAEADLERIGDFIAQDNPQRALTFIAELREKCLTLANSPDAFPLLPRYQQFGVRRRIHGNYLIFYAVDGADIFVLHVLNGAMDYESILFPGA
jgi:plasmid stabilization system protein ParE